MIFEDFKPAYSPFWKILQKMFDQYPEYYQKAEFYHRDFSFKMEYLQLIVLRYLNAKDQFQKILEKGIQIVTEHESMDLHQLSRQIELDTDTFLVFSRMALNRIPHILKPLYKDFVTENEPSTVEFTTHIEWFKKHQSDIRDQMFVKKILDFKEFFELSLRTPRNEIVVHPKGKHYFSSINYEGVVVRFEYELDEKNKRMRTISRTQIEAVDVMFNKIIDFCNYLNDYFIDKMTEL